MDSRGAVQLGDPSFLQSSVSVFFTDQVSVDEASRNLFEILRSHYHPPEQVAVPPEADPEVPRLLFRSQHGFSQVAVSRASVVLTVQYSPQWQRDIAKGEAYLKERLPLLKEMVTKLGGAIAFAGMGTTVHFPAENDRQLVQALAQHHGGSVVLSQPHDINARLTSIVADRFFRNLVIRNYRTWSIPPYDSGLLRLSSANQSEGGLEISIDFNDRFAYNESPDYLSSVVAAGEVLDRGLAELRTLVREVSEGKWL